jgi:hypothetical protein
MDCVSAVAVAAILVGLVLVLNKRQKEESARAVERALESQRQQIEGLRLLVVRLEKRIAEVERGAGIAPEPVVEAPRPAPPPPPEPAVPVPPSSSASSSRGGGGWVGGG